MQEPTISESPEALHNQPPHQSATQRLIFISLAAVVLVGPIAFLLIHNKPKAIAANTNMPVEKMPTLAQLEELAHASPTAANLLNLSVGYINSNLPGRAVPILDALVAADPGNAIAWNNLCVAHTMQLELNIAVADCNRALQAKPDFQLARNNLKWAQDETNKAVQAIAATEQTAPALRGADSYLAEGLNQLHIGNYDQAMAAWQRTLQIDPKNALAANNIGIALMFKKQPATAQQWFEKALALDPGLQIAKNNLQWSIDEQNKNRK